MVNQVFLDSESDLCHPSHNDHSQDSINIMYFIVLIISEVISLANGHFLFTISLLFTWWVLPIDSIIIIIIIFRSMVLPHHMLNIARKSRGNHLLNRLVNKPIVVHEIVFQLCCQREPGKSYPLTQQIWQSFLQKIPLSSWNSRTKLNECAPTSWKKLYH